MKYPRLNCMMVIGLMPLFMGCGLYAPKSTSTSVESETVDQVQHEEPLPLTIGDVEGKVFMTANIAQDSLASNINVEELISRNERVHLRTITITEPFPQSLVCEFHLISEQNFPDNPVAIRGRILRDEDEIGSFVAVLGEHAVRRMVLDVEALPSLKFHFDVLENLDAIPDTMLVVAEMEAMLTPTGTDESTLDPATVQVSSANRNIIRSNPIRINFVRSAQEE